ncbi:hypothetical protein HALLA_15985 [Halostagnicola larsenii XH-48]|uniref:Uncharacterized protein n=1 Tax=Halostagnicola larsenii XH-48 TaxID=797299 RepID=W0JUY7_9EURY|nr:hypothetical protein HALLA_15985 [Halostagnicola larsenii XH-48]
MSTRIEDAERTKLYSSEPDDFADNEGTTILEQSAWPENHRFSVSRRIRDLSNDFTPTTSRSLAGRPSR